jgi:predicted ATPase
VLHVLAVEGYRSLRDLVLPLGRLTVVTGANGSGKSSLYRSLRLLAETARGGAVAALAREGGLPSTLWAGPEAFGPGVRSGRHPVQGTVRTKAVGLRLGFAGDGFGYAIDFGLPPPSTRTLFGQDPEIKREAVWSGPVLRPATLLTQRAGQVVTVRDDAGSWADTGRRLRPGDSMLSEVADPYAAPEVLDVRETVRSWRFYDGFRTDRAAPARSSRVGTSTPVLDPDGADLAAALQTIRELGHGAQVDEVLERAFPGSRLEVVAGDGGTLAARLHQHGLLRPLSAAELSDGTLRYLLWTAALLSPRPPALYVLNEPETSLHPDLLPPLADLVARASRQAQVVAVTHSTVLRDALEAAEPDLQLVRLVKELGETAVEDQGRLERPPWQWPSR